MACRIRFFFLCTFSITLLRLTPSVPCRNKRQDSTHPLANPGSHHQAQEVAQHLPLFVVLVCLLCNECTGTGTGLRPCDASTASTSTTISRSQMYPVCFMPRRWGTLSHGSTDSKLVIIFLCILSPFRQPIRVLFSGSHLVRRRLF